MNIEAIRQYCLSFPYATEDLKWGNDLAFCVGEKMFAVIVLEQTEKTAISLKCTPEKFAELIEIQGIFPAPYTARYNWIGIARLDILKPKELKALIKISYLLIFDQLPSKIKKNLFP